MEESGDHERVKAVVVKLDSSIRDRIKSHIEADQVSTDEIELVNFTHLSGMCGDKVIGANIKFGTVYYHIYILDESCDPQVVKILGPKETSVKITGFN